jgi:hypothetical protein
MHFLKPKKSSGYDEITMKILKACASLICHPLSYIYNYSLYTSIFPDSLKSAVVKPLYKKGDKSSMTNYRPVLLLLTIFSKVYTIDSANTCILTTYKSQKVQLKPKGRDVSRRSSFQTNIVFKSINQKMHIIGIFCDWQRLLIA